MGIEDKGIAGVVDIDPVAASTSSASPPTPCGNTNLSSPEITSKRSSVG
jgi:hypothetical protein